MVPLPCTALHKKKKKKKEEAGTFKERSNCEFSTGLCSALESRGI
jgi:hypothetical protein